MAPGLGHRSRLRLRAAGQRGYAPSCPAAYARPLPQFWNAALTIATRQHAQLLHMHDTLEELETGTESLATGEQVAEWFGRSGPGDWPLHRLKVHIPAAAMAYLCDVEADASASGGGVALKGTIQSSRGMRFVMAGGLKAGYTPPIFQDVEPHRHPAQKSAGPPLRLSRLLRPCGGPRTECHPDGYVDPVPSRRPVLCGLCA